MRAFQQALRLGQRSCVSGVPLHVADPARSMIRLTTRKELEEAGTEELQAIFRDRHILVTDFVETGKCFSWTSGDLQKVTDWNKDVLIHGQLGILCAAERDVLTASCGTDNSLPDTGGPDDRTVRGTIEQLYEHSRYRHASHILNVRHLPNVNGPTATPGLASDALSWLKVSGTEGNISKEELCALEDTRWSLVALRRALTGWHVDAHGFATWVQPMCGQKLWIMARRRDGGCFSTKDFYEEFDIAEPNVEDWIVEVVVLQAGTRL